MTPPVAIVLAAGEGRRMGGPKALLVVDGRPLVSGHVERLRSVGCRTIVVVVRATVAAQVSRLLGDTPEALVLPSSTASMASSLTAGLGVVTPDASQAIIVVPVDTLPVRPATLQALLAAALSPGVQVATPSFHGRGGHPIVARARLLQVFRQGYSGTLRDLIRSSELQRYRLHVEDRAVLGALDTPADLARLRPGSLPSFYDHG